MHARSANAEDSGGEWLLDPFNIDIVDDCTVDCLGDELQEEEQAKGWDIAEPSKAAD